MRLLLLAVAAMAGSTGLTVGVSSNRPGAQSVAVKLKFASELQCGIPVGPPLVVTFPAAERVPRVIARSTVLVNGRAAAAVTVTGHTVSAKVNRPEVLCDVLSRGPLAIAFSRAAKLGNPAAAGTYRVSVRRGTQTVSGAFTIQK